MPILSPNGTSFAGGVKCSITYIFQTFLDFRQKDCVSARTLWNF
jgi:hypothetical protein